MLDFKLFIVNGSFVKWWDEKWIWFCGVLNHNVEVCLGLCWHEELSLSCS
jgi:hypothetical protein